MNIGNVTFAGRPLSDWGIRAVCKNPYEVAKPNVETTHVEGMNGDLHFYYGEFENVVLEYMGIIDNKFDANFHGFKSWVYSRRGYCRLEDSRFPDEYRMAVVLEATEISNRHNVFNIKFNCKPQKFLKTGERAKTLTESGSIYNPTYYTSKPIVRVYGAGTIRINDEIMTVHNNPGYIDIDCDMQECYSKDTNRNGDVELVSGDFFSINPGSNNVLFDAAKVEIYPRFYTI